MSLGPGPKMGPRTHEYPGLWSYILARASAAPGRPDHPRAPGRDARHPRPSGCCSSRSAARRSSPTEAQTAADAAALAAVKDVRAQLMEQVALTGTSDLALINPLRVRAAAESYAQRNKAHVDPARSARRRRQGLGRHQRQARRARRARSARRSARRGPGPRAAGPDRDPRLRRRQHRRDRHRRIKKISDKAWEELDEEISQPAPVRVERLLQRPRQALRAARRARLHGRRERRLRRQPAARGPLRHRLPLPVPQLRRDRRQRLRRGGEARHRRHRQRGPGARLPHDLAGGRAL